MYRYRRCWCVLILFCLFVSLSLPALAAGNELEYPLSEFTQDDLIDGVFYPSENKSFKIYENGNEIVYDEFNLTGDVQDNSSALSAKVGVYSSALNWRTDEEFPLTNSIGYTKLFTKQNVSNVLQGKTCPDVATWEQYMHGQFGYTFQLYYGEPGADTNLSAGAKIGLSLEFPCKIYSGTDYSCTPGFRITQNNIFQSVGSKNSLVADANILNLIPKSFFSTEPIEYYSNVVTVGYIDAETGLDVVLSTYDDIFNIDYVFTLPVQASSVYVDVEYSPRDGVLSSTDFSGKSVRAYFLPLMYSFDVSGSVSLDSSGVNSGLLKSIIEWLRNILNAIQSLPQKIADSVIAGIKNLFIPSVDDLQPKFDEFKTAAFNKLGFVYQVAEDFIDLLQEFFNATVSPTTTLTIPKIALPWDKIDGGEMVLLQETTFNVFPENLEVLRTLCKTVTSMLLVLYFYRSVLVAFEKFFRGD